MISVSIEAYAHCGCEKGVDAKRGTQAAALGGEQRGAVPQLCHPVCDLGRATSPPGPQFPHGLRQGDNTHLIGLLQRLNEQLP